MLQGHLKAIPCLYFSFTPVLYISLFLFCIDAENYKYGGTNFTAFRLIDVDNQDVQKVIYGLVESMVDKEIRFRQTNKQARTPNKQIN